MLGLFQDSRLLTPDLAYDHIVARNFSSSYVSPYTANVVLVLYKCKGMPVQLPSSNDDGRQHGPLPPP